MKGTYNSLKRTGNVIENPQVVLWLSDYPDQKYGAARGDFTPREAAELLFMRVKSISFGQLKNEVDSAEPIVAINIEGDEKQYDAVTGKQLENIKNTDK